MENPPPPKFRYTLSFLNPAFGIDLATLESIAPRIEETDHAHFAEPR